jgi:2Fe-2S ferredoxin
MKINVIDQDGHRHTLDAIEGWQLMEIIRDHGLPIKAECGGACCCATCHVYVSPEWQDKLHDMREDEDEMLDDTFDREDNSRLSCQLIMTEDLDGLEVTLSNTAKPD